MSRTGRPLKRQAEVELKLIDGVCRARQEIKKIRTRFKDNPSRIVVLEAWEIMEKELLELIEVNNGGDGVK